MQPDPLAVFEAALAEAGPPVEVVDASKFFDRTGLLHASLRVAVRGDGPIATGPGRTLWHWSDGVWLPGGDDEVRRRCRHLLGQRWRRSHVDGIVSDLAADHPLISDEQPAEWINCRNGLLDWSTGQLHEHTPDVASTYQLSVPWNPTATCPNVDAWLAQVVPDDCIDLVWEVIGTAIYADQPFHRVVLLLGPGRNGKGTLLRLIAALIGYRFISAVTLQQLGESRFAAASLFGKVANIAGDLDARAITRTDTFKMATGGDVIEAEHKYGHSFRFRNRATFLFSANEPPGTADHTDGFFARWVVIPFTRMRLAPGTEDPNIEAPMHAELEGVLVRAVDGLRRAMDRGGYDMPASVLAATTDYQSNSDPIRRFVGDCLDVSGRHDCTETRGAVYDAYKVWCDDNGHKRMSTQKFWPRLAALDDRIDIHRITSGIRRVGGVLLDDGAHGAVAVTSRHAHGEKGISSAPSAPDSEPF